MTDPSTYKTHISVHFRSKTILLVVDQLEDVAPVAAMCALLGDQYRRRTMFKAREPIPVIRVAVAPHLRHYFASAQTDPDLDTSILTWRAHEAAPGGWRTHVGAPDSIWCLEHALENACYGKSSSREYLSHDDGGMVDLILFPSTSALTLKLWQRLAILLSPSLPQACSKAAVPLVVATLGSLRGTDWLSRMAFDMEYRSSRLSNIQQSSKKEHRPVALVGFSRTLWHCRLVPQSSTLNNNRIITPLMKPNSIVLMVGRDTASRACQPIQMVPSLQSTNQEECLLLLRQTLFDPETDIKVAPIFELISARSTISTPYLCAFLWSLLQDPHMIQFPCFMATLVNNKELQQQSVGSLVLSVLLELLQVIKSICLSVETKNESTAGFDDDTFRHALTQCTSNFIVVELLGTGGTIVEDMTQNRLLDIMYRLFHNETPLIRQFWVLEPLMTRAARAEWQRVTVQSPFPPSLSCPALYRQIHKDSIQHGLGLVLQVGVLCKLRLPTIQRVVELLAGRGDISAVPLRSFGIESRYDLERFLSETHPLEMSCNTSSHKKFRRTQKINYLFSRL